MEEIIALDGKQFKLTVDRPLTATEKAQVLADIRKQTGCGTCGTRTAQPVRNMGGRIASMVPPATCTKTTISSAPGDLATLSATPNNGTANYTVTFLGQFGGAPVVLAGAGLTGFNPQAGLVDGQTTTLVTYQVSDAEIVASAGGPPAALNVNGSGIGVPAGAVNTVRFIVHTIDQCPTGALSCLDYCDLAIICPTPICNFIVT